MKKGLQLFLAAVLFHVLALDGRAQQGVVPTMGKEFWLGFMKNFGFNTPNSLDIFISSPVNTTGTVKMPLLGTSIPFSVTANVTTTVSIPVATAVHIGSDIVNNRSILIETADTVAVFAINFEAYTADGNVVYPTQSLGTDYRIFAYQGLNGFADLLSEFLIVATKDGTEVEITTTTNTLGGHLANTPWTVLLDSGQTYQVQASAPAGDFTGTRIRGTATSGSCRPFAVFSGAVCTNIPVGCTACDHICEQALPSNSWGTKYYTVPFATTTSYTYRVMSGINGTQVTINGGAPINLNAGQWQDFPNVTGPACIQGNQRFAAAQYMQGVTCSGNGDPAFLILNAEEQKINSITFATVVSTVINNHYLNIIVGTSSTNSVTLDGTLVPAASFTTFAACPTHAYAQLPLPPGSHTLTCPTGLTAYVYGMGSAESYAYSVGSFSPLPPIIIDSVFCGLDSTGTLTLSPPEPLFNTYWTALTNPADTLFFGYPWTFTPTGNEVYVVSGDEGISGCENSFYFSVEVDTPPLLLTTANGVAGPASITVCAYEAVQLNVVPDPPGLYVYNWWPDTELSADGIPDPVATPSGTTWFYVSVSTLNGCAVAVDSVLVNVVPGDVLIHEASIQYDDICLGDSSQITLDVQQIIASDGFNAGTGAMWASITNGTPNTVCGSVSGNALYFDGGGTRNATTIDLNTATGGTIRFALKIADGLAPCEDADPGDNVVLEYSNSGGPWTVIATYFEYQYPNFTTIQLAIPPAAQTAATAFRWRQLGAWGPGLDNWALDEVAIAVVDITGLVFSWSPAAGLSNASAQSPLSTPTTTTTYIVTTTDLVSTCVYTDSVHIHVNADYTAWVGNDTTVCNALGLVLNVVHDVPAPFSITWSPAGYLTGSGTANPVVQFDSTMAYDVRVTDATGCSAFDTLLVTVPFSTLQIFSDSSLCSGDSALIDAGFPAASHTWNTGETTQAIWVDSPGIYTVTMLDANGCVTQHSTTITVDPRPIVILGPDTSRCAGETWTLNAGNAGSSFAWSTSAISQQITVSQSATYWVNVTNAFQCTGTDSILVTFDPLPVININDTIVCISETVILDAGNPGSWYAWTTGASSQTISVSQTSGTYGVVVTTSTYCTDSASAILSFINFPVVDIGPDSALCDGQQLTLDAGNPGLNIGWHNGSTAQQITLFDDAYAWVDVNNNYCTTRDSALIVFNPLPQEIGPPSILACLDFPPRYQLLDAGNPECTFAWSTGETSRTIQAAEYGWYHVVITTPLNCTMGDSILVEEYCPSTIYVPNAFTPNGDGNNDLFYPLGNNLAEVELTIYDRWGELIHTGRDNNAFWDASYLGGPVQDGVYIWRVKYRFYMDAHGTLSPENEQVGHVSVLR